MSKILNKQQVTNICLAVYRQCVGEKHCDENIHIISRRAEVSSHTLLKIKKLLIEQGIISCLGNTSNHKVYWNHDKCATYVIAADMIFPIYDNHARTRSKRVKPSVLKRDSANLDSILKFLKKQGACLVCITYRNGYEQKVCSYNLDEFKSEK